MAHTSGTGPSSLRNGRLLLLPTILAVLVVAGFAVLLLALVVDLGPWSKPEMREPAAYAGYAVASVLLTRATIQRAILRPDGAVLSSLFRRRRFRWTDVAGVDLIQREDTGRWRVALRMHSGKRHWVPAFRQGGAGTKLEIEAVNNSDYDRSFPTAPADAPARLAGLHRQLSEAWLRGGGTP
jgi:hypothetical protein